MGQKYKLMEYDLELDSEIIWCEIKAQTLYEDCVENIFKKSWFYGVSSNLLRGKILFL